MKIPTQSERLLIASALLVAGLASGGCRSYLVALEQDSGKYEVLEMLFGQCESECGGSCHCQHGVTAGHCPHRLCYGSDVIQFGRPMGRQPVAAHPLIWPEEPAVPPTSPPLSPTAQPPHPSIGAPEIHSAAFIEALPPTRLLPVPTRPVFSPKPMMLPAQGEVIPTPTDSVAAGP